MFQDGNVQAGAERAAVVVKEISIAEAQSLVLKWDKRTDVPKAKLCPLKVP